MRIDRQDLDQELLRFAQTGHGVVLGAPGVGKTYSLRVLAKELQARSYPFIPLMVESLGEATSDDLRAALGYEGDFQSAMQQVFESGPSGGVVIFDGFDATRSADTRERLTDRVRQVIRWAPPGWHVIVSVRTYDARKSPRMLSLFGPATLEPGNRYIMKDVPVRHFMIPELTDAEVERALTSIPNADGLIDYTKRAVRQLLRRPFNLWLLEQIANAPTGTARSPIHSEIELLGLYWYTQIGAKVDDGARILVLTKLVQHLVATRRLQAPVHEVLDANVEGAWKGLLRDEVIARPREGLATPGVPETVGFRHNILFDYAVAILGIGDSADGVREFLAVDPHRSLFLRPSLTYFFDALWFRDRELFWEILWELLPLEDVPTRLVIRLLPPAVIATNAVAMEDLEPLLQRVRDGEEWGASAVTRVLSALQMMAQINSPLWAQFALKATSCFDPQFAWGVATLLERLVREPDRTPEESAAIGKASRALVTISLERGGAGEKWYEVFGSGVVLDTALRCAATNVPAIVDIVDRICALVGEPGFPIGYFYRLCGAVLELVNVAPESIVRVYHVAYGHQETSAEPTRMGGIVLPMSSNRRQDFEMCRYALSRSFPRFLEVRPIHAVLACVGALQRIAMAERARYMGGSEGGAELEGVEFRGKRRPFVHSGFFSTLEFRYSEMKEVRQAVRKMAVAAVGSEAAKIVDAFAAEAGASSVWGLLLEIGAGAPKSYASLLHELVVSPAILTSYDLHEQVGTFVAAAYPEWTVSERGTFETRVLEELREAVNDQGRAREAKRLTWLLTRAPNDALATQDARDVLAESDEAEMTEWPHPAPAVQMSSSAFTHEMWLAEQGVETQSPLNARILALRQEWERLSASVRNEMAEGEGVDTLVPVILNGCAALEDVDGVDPLVEQSAWTALAGVAMAVARELPPPESVARAAAKKVIMRAARFPAPQPGPGRDDEYRTASWSPSPRTEAIAGWSFLMRVMVEEDGSEFLQSAAQSLEPSERLLVALYAPQYAQSGPKEFWRVAELIANEERNEVVGIAVLDTLARQGADAEVLRRPLARGLIERFVGTEEQGAARSLGDWLAHYALVLDEKWAKDLLGGLVKELPEHLVVLLATLGAVMRRVPEKRPAVSRSKEVVARCTQWVLGVLELVGSRAVAERRANRILGDGIEGSWACADVYCKVIDALTHELWMQIVRNSPDGEDDEDEVRAATDDGAVSGREMFRVFAPIVEGLLNAAEEPDGIGIVAPTAYRLIEIARSVLPADPQAAIAMAARVANASREHSFQHDSLAVKEALAIVETALADHKPEMTVPPSRDYLLRLLDVFADAGWPEANRLVWRLEEVYR